MRTTDKQLIEALRCSATVRTTPDCKACPYGRHEEFLTGQRYYSCDVDRINLDAAMRLQELTGVSE